MPVITTTQSVASVKGLLKDPGVSQRLSVFLSEQNATWLVSEPRPAVRKRGARSGIAHVPVKKVSGRKARRKRKSRSPRVRRRA